MSAGPIHGNLRGTITQLRHCGTATTAPPPALLQTYVGTTCHSYDCPAAAFAFAFFAALVLATILARPGTLILTVPTSALIISMSGTPRSSSRSRCVASGERDSSSRACLAARPFFSVPAAHQDSSGISMRECYTAVKCLFGGAALFSACLRGGKGHTIVGTLFSGTKSLL